MSDELLYFVCANILLAGSCGGVWWRRALDVRINRRIIEQMRSL